MDRSLADFYSALTADSYHLDQLIKVLPRHKLLYIVVPKAASTRIRLTLAKVDGRHMRSLKSERRGKFRGPYDPRGMTVGSFFRLATSPETLRFSFVRNPYARAVSYWAYRFQGKPLIPGDRFVDLYLAHRPGIAANLPVGADQTLSFPQFVSYATAIAERRYDDHLQLQDDILSVNPIKLDFIGKVEDFRRDFIRVLDHLGASRPVREEATIPLNTSRHDDWRTYYTTELADRIYRAYERDFDRFGYARTIGGVKNFSAAGTAVRDQISKTRADEDSSYLVASPVG